MKYPSCTYARVIVIYLLKWFINAILSERVGVLSEPIRCYPPLSKFRLAMFLDPFRPEIYRCSP
nr:hypothetical protein Q903MT_gene3112 [Picea sitchensis]